MEEEKNINPSFLQRWSLVREPLQRWAVPTPVWSCGQWTIWWKRWEEVLKYFFMWNVLKNIVIFDKTSDEMRQNHNLIWIITTREGCILKPFFWQTIQQIVNGTAADICDNEPEYYIKHVKSMWKPSVVVQQVVNGTAADMVGVFPEGSVVVIQSSLDTIVQLGIIFCCWWSCCCYCCCRYWCWCCCCFCWWCFCCCSKYLDGWEFQCDPKFFEHDCLTM